MIWLYMIIFSSFSIFCLFGFWIRWQWNKNYQEKRKFFKIEEISVVIVDDIKSVEENNVHIVTIDK